MEDSARFQFQGTEAPNNELGEFQETKEIHTYSVRTYNDPDNIPLVFIDTPALNSDTYQQIQSYLNQQKRSIHAMLFVINHSTTRLDAIVNHKLSLAKKLQDTFFNNKPVFVAPTFAAGGQFVQKKYLCEYFSRFGLEKCPSVILSSIIDTLIKNIENIGKQNSRLTSGVGSEKVSLLKDIQKSIIDNKVPDMTSKVNQDFIQQIMKVCEIKRNPMHFWHTPDSVNEFKQLLVLHNITLSSNVINPPIK